MPVFIEAFRALANRQRMFGEMQLAEGEEPGSNILHLENWFETRLCGSSHEVGAAPPTPHARAIK